MKRIGIGACIAVFLLIGTFTLAAETAGEGGDAADGKGSSSFKDPASLSNEEARLVIEEMTAAMNRFSERMEGLTGPKDFVKACNGYAETVETIGKQFFGIVRAHPGWGENPPAEVAPALEEYRLALERYDPALNKSARYANDHSDSEDCQKAMKRLNSAIYSMYK